MSGLKNKGIYLPRSLSLSDRIAARSIERNGCCEWTGAVNRNGYGIMRWKGRGGLVHRFRWEAANGPIPDDIHVLHSCDNRKCNKLEHLWIGRHSDNMADMREKGRSRNGMLRGTNHPSARLTEDQVREIRVAKGRLRDIGAAYGVTGGQVWCIKHRKLWRHIP